MSSPIICFGQQPCGFFPKRFLYSKIVTARRLQADMGGEIVLFYHDSDHDPRETQTVLRNRANGEPVKFNFTFENKVQRKWSPLYLKRIPAAWPRETARQLGACLGEGPVAAFRRAQSPLVADFCLEVYAAMGLLDGIRLVRSSSPEVRRAACEISDRFVDVSYQGETVRARLDGNQAKLHEGGNSYVVLPAGEFGKEQISPARDSRLKWMQSVIHCTHYVAGAGERGYLNTADAPEITFVDRQPIDRSDEAYADLPN